jgi:hypothetical protein
MKKFFLILLIIQVPFTKVFSQLAIYNFTGSGNCPNQNLAVYAQPHGIIFSDFSDQNVSCVAANDVYASDNWNTTSSIDLNEFTQFSITANPCYDFTLGNFIFYGQINSAPSSGSTSWHLRSSLDNYASNLSNGTITTSQTAFINALPSVNFTSITAVTFRLYFVNVNSPSTIISIDNVSVSGIANGTAVYYRDMDLDAYGDAASPIYTCSPPAGYCSNNTDCNDQDMSVHPGAIEVCDGQDNDCDGNTDNITFGGNLYYADADGDGFGNNAVSIRACSTPVGYVSDNTDCDDAHATVHPGATEICDGLDNDCMNGIDDNTVSVTWYIDMDADGYGSFSSTIVSCTQPAGYVMNSTDCNDANSAVHPNATEVCNGMDDDCDMLVDENAVDAQNWYEDFDGDSYGNLYSVIQSCFQPAGYVSDNTDCDDNTSVTHPGAMEICDNLDNNCDGFADNNAFDAATWYQDMDMDGFGNPLVSFVSCVAPSGYVSDNTDCLDNNPAAYPGGTEIANNGIDEDCNGSDLIATGIASLNSENGATIFPNPGTDHATVFLAENWKGGIQIEIFSLEGKSLFVYQFINRANLDFETGGLESGIYFIRITDEANSTEIRWVKL